MCKLPAELVETILVRLPVKSLKRFQCVAKSWCLLITSKYFKQCHLHRSCSNLRLILRDTDHSVLSIDLYDPNNTQIINIPFTWKTVYRFSNSCNGLVLVKSDPPVLWNPYTTEYKVLSDHEDPYPGYTTRSLAFYGFAYDFVNDDYKVVRVIQEWTTILRTDIYSLKSDSWRQIENFDYFLPLSQKSLSVHIKGALHTIIKWEPGFESIMAFSVVTETHDELWLPSCINTAEATLSALKNQLYVASYHDSQIDIWVMKHYGVAESWTPLFAIAQPDINPYDNVRPLFACSVYENRVLLSCDDGRRLIWCDWKNRTMEYVPRFDGLPYKFDAESCVESLVSLSKEN